MAAGRTPYGSGASSGTGSIDTVILDYQIGETFTEAQVAGEVHRRNLPARGDVAQHLRSLKKRGYIERREDCWARLR